MKILENVYKPLYLVYLIKGHKMKKKALSPVITTILLILIAIILALIILVWARGFIREQLTKFDEPINMACDDVSFSVSLVGDKLTVTNTGNVPIYRVGIKVGGIGSSDITYSEPLNLLPGSSDSVTFSGGGISRVIPVIIGKTKDNSFKEYNCLNNWKSPE